MADTLSVSELTNQIKLVIESGFDKLSVKGENIKFHTAQLWTSIFYTERFKRANFMRYVEVAKIRL